jgi:hypothetical protein
VPGRRARSQCGWRVLDGMGGSYAEAGRGMALQDAAHDRLAKTYGQSARKDGQIACEARRQAAMFVCRSHVHAAARSTSNKTTRPIRKQPPERHVRKRGERAAEVLCLNAALVYRTLNQINVASV